MYALEVEQRCIRGYVCSSDSEVFNNQPDNSVAWNHRPNSRIVSIELIAFDRNGLLTVNSTWHR